MAGPTADPLYRWVHERARHLRTMPLDPRSVVVVTAWSMTSRLATTPEWLRADLNARMKAVPFDAMGAVLRPQLPLTADEVIEELTPPPHLDGEDALGMLYESLLSSDTRRRGGSHFTPRPVAERIAAMVDPRPGDLVLDPACGGGAFLLATARHLVGGGQSPSAALAAVRGIDLDPAAAWVASSALAIWATKRGVSAVDPPRVDVADFLNVDVDELVTDGVTCVLGNPPFLTPLRSETDRSSLRSSRSIDVDALDLGPYVDDAMLFAASAIGVVSGSDRPGTVCLILPQSSAANRDAAGVRRWIDQRSVMDRVWLDGSPQFTASVRVWAPCLRTKTASSATTRGPGRPVGPGRVEVFSGDATTSRSVVSATPEGVWGGVLAAARGVPALSSSKTAPIGARVSATAGFRDEFYVLAEAASEAEVDRQTGRPIIGDDELALVTTGGIDAGVLRWGERSMTLNRRRSERPVLRLSALEGAAPVGSPLTDRHYARTRAWVDRVRGPKVLLAVQTRVLEACADPDGRTLGVTPVLAIRSDDVSVWHVMAALNNPVATVWAHRNAAGSGLSVGVVRLRASMLPELPVPTDIKAWDDAAARLEESFAVSDAHPLGAIDAQVVADVGSAIGRAMGASEAVDRFWRERLG